MNLFIKSVHYPFSNRSIERITHTLCEFYFYRISYITCWYGIFSYMKGGLTNENNQSSIFSKEQPKLEEVTQSELISQKVENPKSNLSQTTSEI